MDCNVNSAERKTQQDKKNSNTYTYEFHCLSSSFFTPFDFTPLLIVINRSVLFLIAVRALFCLCFTLSVSLSLSLQFVIYFNFFFFAQVWLTSINSANLFMRINLLIERIYRKFMRMSYSNSRMASSVCHFDCKHGPFIADQIENHFKNSPWVYTQSLVPNEMYPIVRFHSRNLETTPQTVLSFLICIQI